VVAHACGPSYYRVGGRWVRSKASQGRVNVRPSLKNDIKQKDWGCGSSGRALEVMTLVPNITKIKK
jgi:hypothetical protein